MLSEENLPAALNEPILFVMNRVTNTGAKTMATKRAERNEAAESMKTYYVAKVWWDASDPHNQGWAWRTSDGTQEESGPLDDCFDNASDEELFAAFREQVGGTMKVVVYR